ncbi:hypothetical protein EDC96DRAFT_576183 [Choanephora cucurbitarum]|nr:hypothetical protein EDC96DRAFT_576183 [Choanephora cucurbitarum]
MQWAFKEMEKKMTSEERVSFERRAEKMLAEEYKGTYLDAANKVSFSLLKDYPSLTEVEVETLKLSLSGLLNVTSAEFQNVLKRHLSTDVFLKIEDVKYHRDVDAETLMVVKETLADLKKEAEKEEPDFKVKHGLKSFSTLENQFTLLHLDAKRSAKGETQCFSTKKYILENEISYSSSDRSSSSTSGRKIDILITTEDEEEIAALEFKAEKSRRSSKKSSNNNSKKSSGKRSALSLGQGGKSIRINRAILSSFPAHIASNCGMDFNGWSGYSYAIMLSNEIHVIVKLKSFVLPSCQKDLEGEFALSILSDK